MRFYSDHRLMCIEVNFLMPTVGGDRSSIIDHRRRPILGCARDAHYTQISRRTQEPERRKVGKDITGPMAHRALPPMRREECQCPAVLARRTSRPKPQSWSVIRLELEASLHTNCCHPLLGHSTLLRVFAATPLREQRVVRRCNRCPLRPAPLRVCSRVEHYVYLIWHN